MATTTRQGTTIKEIDDEEDNCVVHEYDAVASRTGERAASTPNCSREHG